jgi:hypothetical protein
MVVTETIAGLGAVKTAFDMAKALQGIHDATARDRAVIDLQKEILAAQAAQFELVETVSILKKEVTTLKIWDAEKRRYKLAELRAGVFAYSLKEEMANGEPQHNLCAHCYVSDYKSILKQETWNPGQCNMIVCQGCGWFIKIIAQSLTANERLSAYNDIFVGTMP